MWLDTEKVDCVKNHPQPTGIETLRSFSTSCGYFRNFIENFSTITYSLHRLTKKDQPFKWLIDQENAFQALKGSLLTYPILRHFDFSKPCEIHTDASNVGISAVLMQRDENNSEYVVSYASRSLNKAQKNYASTQLELLAVIFGVEKFDPYVAGGPPFIVVTDHSALGPLIKTKNPVGRLARMLLRIQPYEFKIVYRPGKQNMLCDALSRTLPEHNIPVILFSILEDPKMNISQLQNEDAFCARIIKDLKDGSENSNFLSRALNYSLISDVLYKKVIRDTVDFRLLVVPKVVRVEIIQEAHDGVLGGHLGQTNTYYKISRKYYWPGMIEQISRYVQTCEFCQKKKDPPKKKTGFLQPLLVKGPFNRIHMDYAGPFVKSKTGKMYLLLAIDSSTKYIFAQAVTAATAANAAMFLMQRIILVHGQFSELLTDLGTHFTSSVMQHLLKMLRIKHLRCSTAHPATDGNAERALKSFCQIMSNYVEDDHRNWSTTVPYIEFIMNTTRNETTGYTPYSLVYGRMPVLPWDINMAYNAYEEVDDITEYAKEVSNWLTRANEIAIMKINSTHDREAPRFNNKRQKFAYEVGDLVLWWRNLTIKERTTKLLRKWTGPYVITNIPGPVTCMISKPNSKKSFAVHVDKLKKFHNRSFAYNNNDMIEEPINNENGVISTTESQNKTEVKETEIDKNGKLIIETQIPIEELHDDEENNIIMSQSEEESDTLSSLNPIRKQPQRRCKKLLVNNLTLCLFMCCLVIASTQHRRSQRVIFNPTMVEVVSIEVSTDLGKTRPARTKATDKITLLNAIDVKEL